MKQTDPDPLAELREQIRATTAAAERLAAETAAAREASSEPAGRPGTAGGVPPAGWATAEGTAARHQELQALIALVEALRDLVPEELKDQVRDVLRQLLVLVRGLIDWWVERMDGPRPPAASPGPPVEEIPID